MYNSMDTRLRETFDIQDTIAKFFFIQNNEEFFISLNFKIQEIFLCHVKIINITYSKFG